MHRAIWAVFHHSLSSDEKHSHQFCPSGSDSWCKFNCALANDEEPPKHTPKLPMDLGPFIKPVFTELELLEKCVLGATRIRMSPSITSLSFLPYFYLVNQLYFFDLFFLSVYASVCG